MLLGGIYDANDDPREAELLCGVALRKDDLEAFLHDLCELAERKYGGMRFARLLDEDEDDEAMESAYVRWKSDSLEPRYRGRSTVLTRRIGTKGAEMLLLAKQVFESP